jgi:hypothetical protein
MGLELLISLLKGAGTVNNIRKMLFQPTVVEHAAGTLAAVSQETAERLFKEASLLPHKEQQATLDQVASLLEIASTIDDRTKAPWYLRLTGGPDIPEVQAQVERLIWLAVIYRILGHHAKASRRIQRAKETLPELEQAMELHIHGLVLLSGQSRSFAGLPEIEMHRRNHEKTLTELNYVCARLKALGP